MIGYFEKSDLERVDQFLLGALYTPNVGLYDVHSRYTYCLSLSESWRNYVRLYKNIFVGGTSRLSLHVLEQKPFFLH